MSQVVTIHFENHLEHLVGKKRLHHNKEYADFFFRSMQELIEHVLYALLVCFSASFACTVLLMGKGLRWFAGDMAQAEVVHHDELVLLVPVRLYLLIVLGSDFVLRFGEVVFDRASARRAAHGEATARDFERYIAPLLGAASVLAQSPVEVVFFVRSILMQTAIVLALRVGHVPTVAACVALAIGLHDSWTYRSVMVSLTLPTMVRWEVWWSAHIALVATGVALRVHELYDAHIERCLPDTPSYKLTTQRDFLQM